MLFDEPRAEHLERFQGVDHNSHWKQMLNLKPEQVDQADLDQHPWLQHLVVEDAANENTFPVKSTMATKEAQNTKMTKQAKKTKTTMITTKY